ncbi:MAG: hypothetical protein K8953_02975, partial [Proteobacteria bacterium]|nr:hypothetical protein [Pseudomonadota bacterium]
GDGIYADARGGASGAGSIVIDGTGGNAFGNVTGATSGIRAFTDGGAISISNLESIAGNGGNGIDVASGGGAISLVRLGTTRGVGGSGIVVASVGGAIAIQGARSVTGTGGDGIYADVRDGDGMGTGAITIGGVADSAIGNVTGSTSGIRAFTDGGAISITSGHVLSQGRDNAGILAVIGSATANVGSGDITIDTSVGAVTSVGIGLDVRHYGIGAVRIIAGNVVSDTGAIGLRALTRSGADITLALGSTIRGGGVSISTGESMGGATAADRITLMGRASGAVQTNAGDDIVTLRDGGSFGLFDGGAGIDKLILTSMATVISGDTVLDVERVHVDAGVTTLNGALATTYANVASGATLDLSDGSAVVGATVTNAGSLLVAGTDVGAVTITGDLVLAASGTLMLDIAGANGMPIADSLLVSGGVALSSGGTVALRQSGDMMVGELVLIDGGSGLSGDIADLLVSGLVNNGSYAQALRLDAESFDVILVTAVALPGACLITRNGSSADTPLFSGDRLTCIGTVVGAVSTSAGNLTIEVGNADVPTNVLGISSNVFVSGEGLNLQGGDATGGGHRITGAVVGVYMRTLGGDIVISKLASVTGNSGDGVDVASSGGNISLNDIGTVTGYGGRGVAVASAGGSVTIRSVGLVGNITGATGDGIYADARDGAGTGIG